MATDGSQSRTPIAKLVPFRDFFKRFNFRLGVLIATAAYALASGALTLLGWALRIPRLTDWANTGISMFPNPAVCAIGSGAALLVLSSRITAQQHRITVRVLALFVALVGGLTLFEHISGLNLGIDTLLFNRPWGQRGAAAPMPMGPPASTSFLILGAALFLAMGGKQARWFATVLAVVPVAISSLSLIGYWFGTDQLYTLVHLTAISFQMSTILAALGIGLIAAVPEHGIVAQISRDDAGGMLIRRLLLPIIAIPLLLGWLRALGENAGLYDRGFGLSILLLATIALLLALLAVTARSISRASQATKDSRDQLEAVLKQAPLAIGVVDACGHLTMTNDLMRRYAPRAIPSHDHERIGHWRVQGEPVPPQNWPSAKALRGEPAPEVDFIYALDDGQEIGVRSSAASLRDEEGKVIGAIVIMENITGRCRLSLPFVNVNSGTSWSSSVPRQRSGIGTSHKSASCTHHAGSSSAVCRMLRSGTARKNGASGFTPKTTTE